MKITGLQIILILLTGIIITGAQAVTVSVQPVTLSPGESGTADIILDSAPSGLSGYQMTVQSENGAVGVVTGATFPSWAALSEAVSAEGGSYAIRAIDLNSKVESGATEVVFATLSVKAVGSGNTQITIKNLQIDDDAGNALSAETKAGILTVQGGAPPEPSTEEYSVSLQAGWNLGRYPHPSLAAHANLAQHLEGREFLKAVELGDGIYAFVFVGRDRTVAVISGRPGCAAYRLPVAEGLEIRDLFGNPLPQGASYRGTLMFVETAMAADAMERLFTGQQAESQ